MRERDGGDQRRLAVLTSDRQDRAAHRAAPADMHVAEVRLVDVADERLFPPVEFEPPALAVTTRDGQLLDEGDDARGSSLAVRATLGPLRREGPRTCFALRRCWQQGGRQGGRGLM